MPCMDNGRHCPEPNIRDLKSKLDRVTRYLCETLRKVPSDVQLSPEVVAWWEKHEQADRTRSVKECQERVKALKDQVKTIHNLGGVPGTKLLEDLRVAKDHLVLAMGGDLVKTITET